ncbi:MAG: hypothetical protein EPO08_02230 [Rhodospirillaceae bacterium]|nr:MAG: hypothetical protein EPO08_02230 [Rhodospirillaceae bacterium]
MTRITQAGCFSTQFGKAVMACGFGLLVAITPAAAQQHAPERPVDRGVIVRQTTLLVEDMDRALDFYMRLGLSKSSDRTFDEGDQDAIFSAADLPLAADPKSARIVVLRGSSDQAGMIGLVAYDKPRLSSARGNLGGLGTGDIIITVEVTDIQEAYRRLAQIGTRFQRIPYRFTLTNGDGTHQVVMRMLAFDPDGHLAEIVQPDTGHK